MLFLCLHVRLICALNYYLTCLFAKLAETTQQEKKKETHKHTQNKGNNKH